MTRLFFFFQAIRFKFIKALQWRTELLLWIALDIFPFIILLFIWQSVLFVSSTPAISLSELTGFYFFVIFIQGFTSTHFEEYRPEEIRMGKIDFFLIKPYNYLQELILNDLAGKLLYILLFSPLLIILGSILWKIGMLELPQLSLLTGSTFVLLLVLAYVLQLCFSILITLTAFWFDEASGLAHLKWLLVSLFSGTLIPFALLPIWMQQTTDYLPFKFLFAIPIRVLQEQTLPSQADWIFLFSTIIVLLLGINALWKAGIRKYSSAGG